MFDSWNGAFAIAGAGALSYLAAGQRQIVDKKATLRLSLDSSGSLLTDVRLLGGVAAWIASGWASSEKNKSTLSTIAAASIGSLVVTEIVRMQLVKQQAEGKITGVAGQLPFAPNWSYGALGMNAQGSRDRAWSRAA
jgi:uncharacterized membrane protein YeaQ/YmgE (transglycosylase-associated protein family)